MKKKTLLRGALVVAAASVALAPNISYAAGGKLDYSKQNGVTGVEAANLMVRATSDGGYVIAGVTAADGCMSNEGQKDITPISEISESELAPCGYVNKYSVNGAETWSAKFMPSDYSSSKKTYTDNDTEKELGFAYMVNPLKLMETSAGIAMVTEGGDYFLLNSASGEVSKSFSLIEKIYEPTNVTVPHKMFINTDGSVTYGNFLGDSAIHRTSDGATVSDMAQLSFTPLNVYKQQDTYIMDNDSGVYACDENFDCEAIEGVSKGAFVSANENTDGPFRALSTSDTENNKTKYESYVISDGKVVIKKTETYEKIKDGDAPEVESDIDYSIGDGSASTLTSIGGYAESFSGTETNKKTNKRTQTISVSSYDNKLNLLGSVDVAVDDSNYYYSMAFLKDGSLIAVGTMSGAPIYERYVNMVLTARPTTQKASATTTKVKNPKTLDNVAVFGAGLVAAIGAGFVLLKRFMRR